MARRATPIARRLRGNPTEAERRLWRRLRELDVNGSHFRRQVPIGPFIVDFACLAGGLAVELDGGQHFTAEGRKRDGARDRWLSAAGFRVLRFANTDVMENIDGVLEAIAAQVRLRG